MNSLLLKLLKRYLMHIMQQRIENIDNAQMPG